MSEFKERETDKFMQFYFLIRTTYLNHRLLGADHYLAKEFAFDKLDFWENQFFFEQLREKNLTLYDLLSLEQRVDFQ